MGIKNTILSAACVVAISSSSLYANETSFDDLFWVKKYNDFITNTQETNSEQAKRYKAAMDAEIAFVNASDMFDKSYDLYTVANTSYQNQANVVAKADEALNLLKTQQAQAQQNLTTHQNKLSSLNEQNSSYDTLKQSLEEQNKSLQAMIEQNTIKSSDLSAQITTKTQDYTNQSSVLSTKSQQVDTLKAEYHDLIKAYNDALKVAVDQNNESVRQAEVSMKTKEKDFLQAKQEYDFGKVELDMVGADIASLKNQNQNLISQNNQAQQSISNNTSKIDAINQSIAQNQNAINDLNTQIQNTNSNIQKLEQELVAMQNDRQTEQGVLDEKLKELNQAKQDLQTAKDAKDSANQALQDAIMMTSQGQKYLQDIATAVGAKAASIAQDEIKDLASFVASKDTLSQSEQQEAKQKADKIADKIITSQKDEITANSTSTVLVQLNNMTKRLGEVRWLESEDGAWLRGYGGKYSSDDSHFDYYSVQLGADKKISLSDDSNILTGVLFGVDDIDGDIKTKSYSVGVYGSYMDKSGLFVDGVLKYLRTSHDKSGHDFKDQNSFLASAEIGYRMSAFSGVYIEPSIEYITGYISEYEDKSTTTITSKAYMPHIFKPQLFIGGVEDSFAYRLGVGGVISAKAQEATISIDDIVSGINASSTTTIDKNNHTFVSVGGSYKVSDDFVINLGIERSFGGTLVNDYELNAVVRYGF